MILVLTPLAFENEALRAFLSGPGTVTDINRVKVHSFLSGEVHLATGGHGKVQFALTTQMLIRELSPALVICAGACGALTKDLAILDVIAAEQTIEHDFNLRFIKRPLPAFAGHAGSLAALSQLTTAPAGPEFNFRTGVIASGDEDILDAKRAREIHELTGAIAVAWEGAGGARAAAFCKTPFLELRVVTDFADGSAPQDFRKNVTSGMRNLAAIISTLPPRNRG